jgi:4-hydroxy-tetrahydrodipicolinate reductase
MTLRIAVAGASGRMGRMLIEAVLAAPDCTAGALDIAGSPAWARTPAPSPAATGVAITATCARLAGAEVLIDFTRPEGTLAHLAACRRLGVKAVIGTTGFTDAQKAEIAAMPRTLRCAGAQHERGRQRGAALLDTGRPGAGEGYDIEVDRGAPPPQGRRPQRHRAAMGEVWPPRWAAT